MENKVAIIIVVFNIDNLISTQIDLIKRFCKDEYDIVVIDNSNNLQIANNIKNVVETSECQYSKTSSTSDFSQSHASACNYAYNLLKGKYNYMFFLDHDNFPVKSFSVSNILENKVIGGVGQSRKDKYYFWPGCVMFNDSKIEDGLIDFNINANLGLDTGGNLYKIIEKYGLEQCVHFDQYDIENCFDKSYYYYNLICNQKITPSEFSFMHFINASNWNKHPRNKERVASLLEILKTYVGSLL